MILPGDADTSIAAAAECIRAGDLLGLPTETVYGLAANADNDAAVAQIFKAKGRPADHPLIVHVLDASAVAHYAAEVPAFAQALIDAFWPGPLTVILPRRPNVATAAAGSNPSIGLRCPSHPVAQALLRALSSGGQIPSPSEQATSGSLGGRALCAGQGGARRQMPEGGAEIRGSKPASAGLDELKSRSLWLRHVHGAERSAAQTPGSKQLESDPQFFKVWGLAAPSANQFGRVSPTTAAHVHSEFGDTLLILDGDACDVGIESTIIDCTRGQPVLLRPGAITPAQVHAACGLKVLSKEELLTHTAHAPRASGTLESHYAPRATVRLMNTQELRTAVKLLGSDAGAPAKLAQPGQPPSIALYCRTPMAVKSPQVLQRRMPDRADAAAQELFAALRGFDLSGVKLIWVETLPDTPEWDGVRDRLARAAS